MILSDEMTNFRPFEVRNGNSPRVGFYLIQGMSRDDVAMTLQLERPRHSSIS